jgi:DNA-binding FrmR family transcriptional regulator
MGASSKFRSKKLKLNKGKPPRVRGPQESEIKLQSSKQTPVDIRLNKVKGQIEGIKKMYDSDPCDCVSLVTQIQAARAALNQVAKVILSNEANRCVESGNSVKLEEVVNKTFNVI